MNNHRACGRRGLLAVAGLVTLSFTAGCNSSSPSAATIPTRVPVAAPITTTSAAPTTAAVPAATTDVSTTSTTVLAVTSTTRTTAMWVPRSPAPNATQAAYNLVEAWAAGRQTAASTDASPAAVAVLFSNPYPVTGTDFRGCSSPPDLSIPSSCVLRVGNDLLSLTVSHFSEGWGVTSVLMET
jgi:hypothetical protein